MRRRPLGSSSPANVKQSISLASPPVAWKVVASTMVPSRYSRNGDSVGPSLGSTEQNPPPSQSSRRAKHAPESKRGRQHQSIEPASETSAAAWQSEIRA